MGSLRRNGRVRKKTVTLYVYSNTFLRYRYLI